MDIKSLSLFQLQVMRDATATPHHLFLIPMPCDKDASGQRMKLASNVLEAAELRDMGLIANVSQEYRNELKDQFDLTGREFIVYVLTDNAVTAFKPETGTTHIH